MQPDRTTIIFENGETKWDTLNKADVGLDKVDNTADLEKPVSAAQQAAIDAAITPALLGANEPVHKKRFKLLLVISLAVILSAFIIKILNVHIIKTRNTFRITSDRIWKGEVKHKVK